MQIPRALGQLSEVRHLALDLDGTVAKDGQLFDAAPAFLECLGQLGIGYTFLTNNSSCSSRDYQSQLRTMGMSVTTTQLYTSAQATIEYLRQRHPQSHRVFVLGTPSLSEEFAAAGFTVTQPDAEDVPEVVVVGFDTTLDYGRLCRAAYWIDQGKPFIATHPDRVCPTAQPTLLVDCGAICACLETATGRRPDAVLGKPQRHMLDGILARHHLAAAQVAVVGDRLYTDIALAHAAGALGVLVLTGESTAADAVNSVTAPDFIVRDLTELQGLLKAAHGLS